MTLPEILSFEMNNEIQKILSICCKGRGIKIIAANEIDYVFTKAEVNVIVVTNEDWILNVIPFGGDCYILYVDGRNKSITVLMKGGDVEKGILIFNEIRSIV